MNVAKHESKRLEQILIRDKLKNPARFCEILKKETEHFLNNFFEIVSDSLNVDVKVDNEGFYCYYICGKASRIHICN